MLGGQIVFNAALVDCFMSVLQILQVILQFFLGDQSFLVKLDQLLLPV